MEIACLQNVLQCITIVLREIIEVFIMSTRKTVSFRLDPNLVNPVDEWLKLNHLTFSVLANLAIQQFIAQNQNLSNVEVKAASDESIDEAINEMIKEHRDAIDRLK